MAFTLAEETATRVDNRNPTNVSSYDCTVSRKTLC